MRPLGPRAYGAFLLLALASLFVLGSTALLLGAALSPRAAMSALFLGTDPVAHQILWELRLPRVLGAALVGGTLAVVGATLQAVMQNPLADPYILGICAAASVGAVLGGVLGLGLATPILAFGAGLAGILAVFRLAGGGRVPLHLLLAGVALSSFATAITSLLLFLEPDANRARGAIFWLMGGFSGAEWPALGWTTAGLLLPLAALFLTTRSQTVLLLGDEAALTLGLDVPAARRRLVALASWCTALVVAFAGAVGFVGLIVPHVLRPLTGPAHARLLPASFFVGAILLVAMDLLARVLLAPEELPVGILSGLIGAPFFLGLLRRQGRAHG